MVQNVMPHRIKPSFDVYDGDDKYIFITYAHKDAKAVFSDLEQFNELDINIFYDEGLPSGATWLESIETKILKSHIFVPFLTPNTVKSNVSRDEIFLAYRSDIPIIPIYLKETKLEKGLNLALGSQQAIFKYEMSDETYFQTYTREFKRHNLIDVNNEIDIESSKFTNNSKKKITNIGKSAARMRPTRLWIRAMNKIGVGIRPGTVRQENPRRWKYIYISYSNKDIGLVIPEIERYMMDDYRIKFDKGLNYNNVNDRSKIFELISACGIFVVFLSENSIDSNQVKMELKTAYDNNKIIIPIYLEETELSSEFESILESTRFINKYMMNEEQYIEAYVDAFDTVLIKQ